ncbi:MAG: hypothetical protein AAF195_01335 [Pseudomonadota bacterium]
MSIYFEDGNYYFRLKKEEFNIIKQELNIIISSSKMYEFLDDKENKILLEYAKKINTLTVNEYNVYILPLTLDNGGDVLGVALIERAELYFDLKQDLHYARKVESIGNHLIS